MNKDIQAKNKAFSKTAQGQAWDICKAFMLRDLEDIRLLIDARLEEDKNKEPEM